MNQLRKELLMPIEETKLELINFKDVPAVPVDWLWYPYIAFGKISLIHGNAGDGKTFLSLKIAADCSNGTPLPGNPRECNPIKIIYQSAEDGLSDTIKPRLIDTNANYENVYTIDESEKVLTFDDPRVEEAIVKTGARLIIFDPIQAYVGKDVDLNSASDMRRVTRPLTQLAEKYKVAVIIVGHVNKTRGISSIGKNLGSSDIPAVARSVLVVGRYKNDPSVRVIVQDKNSLAPEGTPMAFRLDSDKGFEWVEGYDDVTATDILFAERGSRNSRCTKLDTTIDFLQDLFAEVGTRIPATEVYARAIAIGVAKRTVDTAKRYVPGLSSEKDGKIWFWYIDLTKLPHEEVHEFNEDDYPMEVFDDDEEILEKEGCKHANIYEPCTVE
ncbi:MAG: AAA family ATPase [Saccharofermentans sp.]|nr:AAA family ATPase [Saccharofermentans sp.]